MAKMNEYAALLNSKFYTRCSKAVLAALAVSFANQIHEDLIVTHDVSATETLLDEWVALHQNGIVTQPPHD